MKRVFASTSLYRSLPHRQSAAPQRLLAVSALLGCTAIAGATTPSMVVDKLSVKWLISAPGICSDIEYRAFYQGSDDIKALKVYSFASYSMSAKSTYNEILTKVLDGGSSGGIVLKRNDNDQWFYYGARALNYDSKYIIGVDVLGSQSNSAGKTYTPVCIAVYTRIP